jgi:hypothetical protein
MMVRTHRDAGVETPDDDHPTLHAQVLSALEVAKITWAAARAAEADLYESARYNVAMMSLVVAEQMLALRLFDAAMRHAGRAREQFLVSAQRAALRAAR